MLVQTILEELSRFPESHVLLESAQRTNMDIGVRGGVVRNLIAAGLGLTKVPGQFQPSLFDLVDPLGDMNIVVRDDAKWRRLAPVIASMLPLSRFFTWRVITAADQYHVRASYGHTQLDTFTLWFYADGTLNITHTEGSAEYTLDQIATTGHVDLNVPTGGHVNKLDFLAWWLHAQRVQQQFDGIEVTGLWELEHQARRAAAPPLPFARLDEYRTLIGKLLFTANTLAGAADTLRVLKEIEPQFATTIDDIIGALGTAADKPTDKYLQSVVYPWPIEDPPAGFLQAGLAPTKDTLIPWIPVRTGTTHETGWMDCCPPDVFRPIVLAYRGPAREYDRLKDFSLLETGIVGRAHRRGDALAGPDVTEDTAEFAVPALHSIGTTTTLRVDHEYLRSVLGDERQAFIGLVDVRRKTEERREKTT